VATEASAMRVRIRSAGLGSRSCGSAGPLDACWRGAVVSFNDIGFLTLQTMVAVADVFWSHMPLEEQDGIYIRSCRAARVQITE
jgi:hypothetical protein